MLQMDALMGAVTDTELAQRLGTTRQVVSYWRRKYGIPGAYNGRGKPRVPDRYFLDCLSSVTVKSTAEITKEIREDYGSITTRSVLRRLNEYLQLGFIERVVDEDMAPQGGYRICDRRAFIEFYQRSLDEE